MLVRRPLLTLLSFSLTLLPACQSGSPRPRLAEAFDRRGPRDAMLVALSDADPDERREAVQDVSASDEAGQDWAIDGLITIALLEPDNQTRCSAIRGLARTGSPRAVETCLKLLTAADHPPQQVRPPEPLARWDAVLSLGDLVRGGVPAPAERTRVRDVLLATLRSDPDRNVRIAAAQALEGHAELPVLRGLIAALNDSDFAVVHACEDSLARLTGQTHNCDPHAWEQWLAANESQAFAGAGTLPESRRPKYTNKVEKAWHDTRQTVQWLVPASKN